MLYGGGDPGYADAVIAQCPLLLMISAVESKRPEASSGKSKPLQATSNESDGHQG